MNVLLLGASGRIGQRTAAELLDRDHNVTGVSRSGTIDGVDQHNLTVVTGDATDPDAMAQLIAGHDAVVSTLGPSDDESVGILSEMVSAVVEGMRRASVDRLVWTGGAGILNVGPDTRLIETDEFPEEWTAVSQAAIDAYGLLEDVDELRWTYVAPAGLIEPGDRTGEYRTADGELVVDENGESYISMEDFAIALVDRLEADDEIHTQLGVGY